MTNKFFEFLETATAFMGGLLPALTVLYILIQYAR